MKLAVALATAFIVGALGVPAFASGACEEGQSDEECASATDGGFGVEIVHRPEKRDARPTSNGGSGPAPVRKETWYAPTCTGNSVYDSGVLCGAALGTCPVEGEVRFWKWQRVYDEATDRWGSWRLADTVCLGPDDPVIDPAVAIPAIVQRDFKRVVVVKGAADVSPRPETLVNVATRFRTDAPASYDIPLTILGQSVVITAKAEKHTWHFGDGTTGTSFEPDGYAEHTYEQAKTRQAYVVITWSGTFSINGGASRPIAGNATTTGDPVAVAVRQARTELVRD